jgi:hypothetical protein
MVYNRDYQAELPYNICFLMLMPYNIDAWIGPTAKNKERVWQRACTRLIDSFKVLIFKTNKEIQMLLCFAFVYIV